MYECCIGIENACANAFQVLIPPPLTMMELSSNSTANKSGGVTLAMEGRDIKLRQGMACLDQCKSNKR